MIETPGRLVSGGLVRVMGGRRIGVAVVSRGVLKDQVAEICLGHLQKLRYCHRAFWGRAHVADGMVTFLVSRNLGTRAVCVQFATDPHVCLSNKKTRIREDREPRTVDDE